MTATHAKAAFSLVLTPMQVPEAIVEDAELVRGLTGGVTSNTSPSGPSLVLRPGETSEMMVQIRNQSGDPLQVHYQIQGDFPPEWCQFRTEGVDLRPGQQLEGGLYVAIAPNYLEQSLTADQLPLKLDYQGRITIVSTNQKSGQRYLESRDFQLHLRPHSDYLEFLPDLYREVDLVGRFLKIFEQTFEPAVNTLDTLWAYLDPLTAPHTLLPFLAHWVGWTFDSPLPVQRQRFLIRHALQIYRWRGTRRGLRFYLHLATGLPSDDHLPTETQKHIGIHEAFHQGLVLGTANLGQDAILGGGQPYHFTVHLRPERDQPIDESLVRQIIAQEKPAFCTYDLVIDRAYAPP